MIPSKKKVLVVDDDPNIVELLTMVLQDAGYQVAAASNGGEAVHGALRSRPDVIILDVVMPVMDGWATCDHLLSHEQTAGIPIIFLTARSQPDDQLRGWYAGCFDYVTKPFDVDRLLSCVRKATNAKNDASRHAWEQLRKERIAILEVGEEESSGTGMADA